MPPLLRRPIEGRLLAGVAAATADYFDVDVAVVRIALVLLALLGGVAVPLYVAAWFLIPGEGTDDPVIERLLFDLDRPPGRSPAHPPVWPCSAWPCSHAAGPATPTATEPSPNASVTTTPPTVRVATAPDPQEAQP